MLVLCCMGHKHLYYVTKTFATMITATVAPQLICTCVTRMTSFAILSASVALTILFASEVLAHGIQ